MSEEKKNSGNDGQPVPPLKIEIVKDDEGQEESLGERDPLAGIDDIDIDKNRRDTEEKQEKE